jgi:hypothetical protein
LLLLLLLLLLLAALALLLLLVLQLPAGQQDTGSSNQTEVQTLTSMNCWVHCRRSGAAPPEEHTYKPAQCTGHSQLS